MSYINRPPPVNGNIDTWGERLNDWLVRNRSKLAYYLTGQPATEDGILLWDAVNSRILVSSNNAWVEVGAGGGGGSITNYLRDDADDSTSFRLTMGGLTVDTNTLYVDSVNNEVGIGTTNPSEKLEVVGNVEATEFIGDLRGAVVFKAQAGEALAIGDVVYISGISGNTTVVNKADADDAAKMPAFGLAANSVSNNANVEIYTFGTLAGVDTSSYTEGDELFVGTTAGALVSTAPTGEGSLVQKIGKVTRSHGSAGSIKIMGAGRTNATPNLDSGNFFLGDSNNQAVTTSFTTAVAAAETSHANVLVDGDFTSNGFMKRTSAGNYAIDSNTYLTSFTELNNLSTSVTWADVPDANITETSVTQHQTAINSGVSITESQISDLGAYLTSFDITTQTDPKYLRADADDTTTGTITAPNLDISTAGSVTTNIATGTAIQGSGTKILNLGTGFAAFADLTTVNIGTQYTSGQNLINVGSGVSVSGNEDTINLKGNVNVDGTITAPNVEISTTGSVTTNIATGTGGSGDTKTVNIATGYSTGGTTTVNIASTSSTTTKQINLNGDVSINGKVTSEIDATIASPSQNTPVLKLRKNSASANGTGRFITLNSSTTSGGSDITRGLIGLSNTSSPQYSHPYVSHASGNVGILCTLSGSSSFTAIAPCLPTGITSNGSLNLGHAYAKWNTVFASSGSINTSDITKKQDIEELSEAESRVAIAAKGLLRKYRWKEAVSEKGDNARIHFGIMAQDLKEAFEAEGLDAHQYGMFCADTRWTTDGTVTYATEEEALEAVAEKETPQAITEETVYGVRYEELLAFIIAAM